MNMISTGAFLTEMDASDKQETLAEQFARVWEKKNSKAVRAGGVSLMALSLAACGSSSTTTTASDDTASDDTASDDTATDDTASDDTTDDVVTVDPAPAVNTITKALLDFASGDTLAGTDGDDVLNVEINADLGATTTISGIETIDVTSYGATTINFTKITDVEKFIISDSTDTVTLASVNDATMVLGFAGSGTNTMVAGYKAGALDGSDDTLNIELNGASAVSLTVDAGFENIALDTGGASGSGGQAAVEASDLDSITVPGVTKATVTGAGALDVAAASGSGSSVSGMTSIDASAMTGAITSGTASAATGFVGNTITGSTSGSTILLGSGNDNIGYTNAAATKASSIKLGAGDDMLLLNPAANGSVVVMGEAGDDHIRVETTALEVSDIINGGDGDDTLTLAVAGDNELLLRSVENLVLTSTATGDQTLTADGAVAVTAKVAASAVHLSDLSAGSTVSVELTKATSTQATNVEAGWKAAEAASTVSLGGGASGNITITNVVDLTVTADDAISSNAKIFKADNTKTTKLTMNLEEVVKDTGDALEIEDVAAVTDMTITASKAAVFNTIGASSGIDALKTLSITGEKAVTVGNIGDANDSTATTVEDITISAKGAATVGSLLVTSSLKNYTVTADGATSGDLTIENAAAATKIETVTLTSSKGSVTANEFGTSGSGTAAATFTASAYDEINLDEPVYFNNASGNTVSLTSSNKGAILDSSASGNAVIYNEIGDISATLSTAGAAGLTLHAGSSGTDFGVATIDATAVTGGSTLTVNNFGDTTVLTETSTVTLGAAGSGKTNAVTVDGVTDVMNITGGSGTDTVAFAGDDDHMTSGTINLAGGGSDKIDFSGIDDALSADTEGVIINASNAAVVRDTGETYSTSIAAMTAAEYDDGAATKDVSTTDFSVVFSGVEQFVGTAVADVFIAGNTGSTFTGGGGNDEITLGAGTDTVVFSASSNGVDTISGFEAGADGDLIDVTGYLTTFATANVDAVPLVTSDDAMENDHVFVVNFDGDIAAKALEAGDFGDLFDAADGYLLTTTGDLEAVVVVQGDDQTEVFYITNDGLAAIDADDVTLIATLSDVTNADTITSDNFVAA